MPTFPRNFSIGTTPTAVLQRNDKRSAWRVTMYSTTLAPGNTGRVHIGRDVVPSTTVGEPNTGDVLVQGAEISEAKRFPQEQIWTGDLWLISNIAGQLVMVEETIEV